MYITIIILIWLTCIFLAKHSLIPHADERHEMTMDVFSSVEIIILAKCNIITMKGTLT